MALQNNPMQPSAALAAIVGSKKISRPQAVKSVWAYIKKNKLQDNKNKRNINADSKLAVLFGKKKQVSMFELASLISKNLK
jgi:chromatin remodeling complex protein RSC6